MRRALTIAAVLVTSACASPQVPDSNRYEFAFATPEDCAVVAGLRAALPAPGRSLTIAQPFRGLEPVSGRGWPFSIDMGPHSTQDRIGPLNLSNCEWGGEGLVTVGPPPVGYLTPVYSLDRTMALTGISSAPNAWPARWKAALMVKGPQGWRVQQWADYTTTIIDPREVQ